MSKKTLAVDFDGVINSYESGWIVGEPTNLPDDPVAGAMDFIVEAQKTFQVVIHSSRLKYAGAEVSMKAYFRKHLHAEGFSPSAVQSCLALLEFMIEKPPAFVILDDRAITFTGDFPSIKALEEFVPWNKK